MQATIQTLRTRLKEFTILKNETQGVLYDRASLNLRPLPVQTAQVFEQIIENIDALPDDSPLWDSISEIAKHYLQPPVSNILDGISPSATETIQDSIRKQVSPQRYLPKLAINIANDCNLGCSYCYANHGLYGTPVRELISEQEIETVVTRFAERFDFIEQVQFMGGEPSINPRAIQRAGEVFERLVDEGRLLGFPEFTMVTNALRFTPRFLDVVKRYNARLTISLDGPKEINDSIRFKKNGQGSYEAIRRSIDKALEQNTTLGFQATFTKLHLEHRFSLIDLCQWFFEEFGVRALHAPPMSENRYGTDPLALSTQDKIREYCAVTEWGIDNLFERGLYLLHGFTARLLENFEKHVRNRHVCPAGNSLLSVSTKGDVYPCWMYTDEQPFVMGNVKTSDFLGPQAVEVLRTMRQHELQTHPACQVCLIQPVCFGCKGGDYHTTGTMDGKTNCDYMRAMVATFIMRLFSRPFVPQSSAEYLSRTSFGEQIWSSIRPKVDDRSVMIPLAQITRRAQGA